MSETAALQGTLRLTLDLRPQLQPRVPIAEAALSAPSRQSGPQNGARSGEGQSASALEITQRLSNLMAQPLLPFARVLTSYDLQEAEERENRYRQSEKEAEKERKGKAMLGFEEDRRLRKEKDEREKLVRDSRAAAAAAAAAAAPPPPDPHSVDAHHPLFNTQSNAADTMDVDPAHGDLPPSYGASLIASGSGGRVLGTGAVVGGPPPGVRMVHQQDLDEDEDEDEEDY